MASAHGGLLLPLKTYIVAYVRHARPADEAGEAGIADELRQTFAELENIQKHPVQRVRLESLATVLQQRAQRLRAPAPATAAPDTARQALATAFGDYIDDMIGYLDRAGELRREQLTLLIGDLLADLKPLALHQDDENMRALAEQIENKRAQVLSQQRPWQESQMMNDE